MKKTGRKPLTEEAFLLRLNVASVVLLLGLWYLASELLVSTRELLPPPHAVIEPFSEKPDYFFANAWTSIYRVLCALGLALVLGIPAGFLMGWYRIARGLAEPLVQFLRTVPPIALIPLVIVWLGPGEEAKVFVIWLSAFLTLVVAVYQGVRNVDPLLIKAARVLGASDTALFAGVVVPAALPYIMVGLRLGVASAWATLVAAELLPSRRGLGYMIQAAAARYEVDTVLLGILAIGFLGLASDRAVLALERKLTPWQERVAR